jgi:uncharacterized protein involved in type VI secretion and phage assembly
MPELDLTGLLQGQVRLLESELDRSRPRIDGVTLGVVTDVNDCKFLGRVKVRFPWLSDQVESAWAGVAVPWAGQGRGSHFLPEVDDQVLVTFRHGDVRYPYIVGFLRSEKARAPNLDPKLQRSELRSKTGHVLAFDDSQGAERLTVQCASGHRIVLDQRGVDVRVDLREPPGTARIAIDARSRSVTVTMPQGNVQIQAAQGSVAVDAATIALTATGPLNLKGNPVRINCT